MTGLMKREPKSDILSKFIFYEIIRACKYEDPIDCGVVVFEPLVLIYCRADFFFHFVFDSAEGVVWAVANTVFGGPTGFFNVERNHNYTMVM